jgi:hypothetical protein
MNIGDGVQMKYRVEYAWDINICDVIANNEEEAIEKVRKYYETWEDVEGVNNTDGYGPAIISVKEIK